MVKCILGKVKRIEKFGAFVEIFQGKDGLVHISELAEERVGKVEDVVKIGDEMLVKVIEIDKQGRVNLSRKAVLKEQRQHEEKCSKLMKFNTVSGRPLAVYLWKALV